MSEFRKIPIEAATLHATYSLPGRFTEITTLNKIKVPGLAMWLCPLGLYVEHTDKHKRPITKAAMVPLANIKGFAFADDYVKPEEEKTKKPA